jgi:hypothetical protein
MMFNLVALAGLLIVASLSVYAFSLQRKVWQRDAELKGQEEALEEETRAQRLRINRSIQIIAKGALEDQLSLTETSIRIKVLLDSLGLEVSVTENYQAFYDLALACDHIPILEQWQALSDKEQRKLEKERIRHEQTHGEAVLDAAKRIKGQDF